MSRGNFGGCPGINLPCYCPPLQGYSWVVFFPLTGLLGGVRKVHLKSGGDYQYALWIFFPLYKGVRGIMASTSWLSCSFILSFFLAYSGELDDGIAAKANCCCNQKIPQIG